MNQQQFDLQFLLRFDRDVQRGGAPLLKSSVIFTKKKKNKIFLYIVKIVGVRSLDDKTKRRFQIRRPHASV
jgi:hypothetical protein